MIYALDPGTTRSALVVLDGDRIVDRRDDENEPIRCYLGREARDVHAHTHTLVIEQVASYGMPVGAEVFTTVFWAGRFAQTWLDGRCQALVLLPRLQVKLALCHDSRAKDAHIRQAILDRFGGKAATRKGGPLWGITGDLWAALGLGLTYQTIAPQTAAQAAQETR